MSLGGELKEAALEIRLKLRIAGGLIVLVFMATAAPPKIEVHGHRGARWARPENTLPAFQYALESGVDVLELDMFVTKDNQVVVTHDPFLNPDLCVDEKGGKIKPDIRVRSLTLKELKTYDCGRLKNPRFPSQQPVAYTSIPTLKEVFELVKTSKLSAAKTVRFNIETKSEESHPDWTPAPTEFVQRVLEIVKAYGWMDRVILQSFDYRTLKAAKDLEPDLVTSLLIETRPPKGQMVALAKQYKVQIVSPNHEWLTESDVQQLHGIGVKLAPWTANSKEDWSKLRAMKVDAVITDNPHDLIQFLREN